MTEAALPRVSIGERPAPGLASRFLGFFGTLMRRKPLGFISLVIIAIMVVVALFPGVFATHSPERTNVAPRFQPYCLGPSGSFLCSSSIETDAVLGIERESSGALSEPLGTDQLGRDTYSRIVHGTKWALYIGLLAVGLSSILALVIGVTCGYFGGLWDATVQRFVDAIMALPGLVVLLALPSMIGRADLDGPLPFDDNRITFFKLALVLGVLGGAGGSRVIRASVIGVRSSQYLEAARVIGARDTRIMLRHVVPNIFGPLIVQATIGLGGVILAESALSFLGFGVVDPDKPTWGQMLGLAQQVASVKPMQAVWPGIAIALAVFSFNMLGDALRDLLDPRLRGAKGGFS